MADTPEVAAARAALARYDAPRCGAPVPDYDYDYGAGWTCDLVPGHDGVHQTGSRHLAAGHLRAALEALDAATRRAEELDADAKAGIEANIHQTTIIGRERARRKEAEADRDRLRSLLAGAHAALACRVPDEPPEVMALIARVSDELAGGGK